MKKIILILIISIGLIGCEKENIECECNKEYYEIVATIVFDSNGIPHTQIDHVLQYTESVICQDEVSQQSTGGYTYFNINCR